jgi:hypothetical protein
VTIPHLTGDDASSTGLSLTTVTSGDWWDTTNSGPTTPTSIPADRAQGGETELRTIAKVFPWIRHH